jgi:hydrogenase expression/formation protein HypC
VRGDPFPRCDHEDGCITCGDEAVAMKLLWLEHEPGLALCADGDGRTQTVDVGLVDAGAGDRVLVHAGTALMRIEQEAHA